LTNTRTLTFDSLDDMIQVDISSQVEDKDIPTEEISRAQLIDLVKNMLAIDQLERFTPDKALGHPFLTQRAWTIIAIDNQQQQHQTMLNICIVLLSRD